MLKIKNFIINLLNHTLCGILISGMPEFFGYINPWLVMIGIVHLGWLVSTLQKPIELLFLIANCIGFYLFFHYPVPDVLDSFLMIDSLWVNIVINVGIAVVIKIPMLWKPIIKVFMTRYEFKPTAVFLVVLTTLISLFKVYVTFGWASSVAYTLNQWVEYLIWLPVFGSIVYVYFISLVVGLLAFKINNKFLITLTLVFIASHIFPNFKIEEDTSKKFTIGVVQYPYYLLNHQKEAPDLLGLKQRFSSLLKNESADLLVFPEASALFTLENPHDWITNPYIGALKKADANLLISGYKKENESFYNTSILISKTSVPKIYYKNKLFPVGEKPVWGISTFNAGPFASVLSEKRDLSVWTIDEFNILPLLCFENFHNYFWRTRIVNSPGPVQITTLQSNEGWVKDKLIRNNLLSYAQIQAKEMGVYVAKADTAGPSAIIGPDGKVIISASEPISIVKAKISKLKKNSFYSRHGVMPFFLLVLVQLLVLFYNKKNND